jgi:hypothetical protein
MRSLASASEVTPSTTGAALHQLTEGAKIEKHGVELDAARAAASGDWRDCDDSRQRVRYGGEVGELR